MGKQGLKGTLAKQAAQKQKLQAKRQKKTIGRDEPKRKFGSKKLEENLKSQKRTVEKDKSEEKSWKQSWTGKVRRGQSQEKSRERKIRTAKLNEKRWKKQVNLVRLLLVPEAARRG